MLVKRAFSLARPIVPRNPSESAKWLAELCHQMEGHLDEYRFEPDRTVFSFRLLQWFVIAVRAEGSLERALGLHRGKGRPKQIGPGKHFHLIRQAFVLK